MFAQPGSGASYVNVRSGPGAEHASLERLAPNTEVWARGRAVASDGWPWLVVTTSSGTEGYVKEALLGPEFAEASISYEAPAPVTAEDATARECRVVNDHERISESLASTICNDEELAALHVEVHRLNVELGRIRGRDEGHSRAAAVGSMWVCGAFGDERTCLEARLRGEIDQFNELIARDSVNCESVYCRQ